MNFQDNTTGISTNSITLLQKVLGTTNFTVLNYFDSPTNGRLRYIGTRNITVLGVFSVFSKHTDSSAYHKYAFYKNGVMVNSSKMYGTTDGNGTHVNITYTALMPMVTNDYIEVYYAGTTSNDTLINGTLTAVNLVVTLSTIS
jgi:hypothetical protein